MCHYLDRLNEISAVLTQRMRESGYGCSAMGGASIAFATQEEKQELHELHLKLQELARVDALGAKERIAERIRNRKLQAALAH